MLAALAVDRARALFAAGAVTVLAAVVLAGATYAGTTLIGRYEFVPVVVLAVAVFAGTILTARHSGRPFYDRVGRPRAPARRLPARADGVFALCVLGGLFGLVGFVSWLVATRHGSPAYDRARHRYVLQSHGSSVVVSKATYDHAVVLLDRGVLGFASIFACVALGLLMARFAAPCGPVARRSVVGNGPDA